ncbi:DNA replication factor Dna2, partial [Ostertagia ostertagi]
MKKLDVVESAADSKQSTPLKRLPKKEAAVHSDFSDWDESPIKNAPACPQGSLVHHVAEKENSDLNDSFDDPVILSTPSQFVNKNEEWLVDLCGVTDKANSQKFIKDHWAETNVEPNTRIRLIGAKPWGDSDWLVSNEHGVMIVAPDTLVPCTSIAGATWCPRKVILNERFRGPTEANKAMLIGNIVHEMFQAVFVVHLALSTQGLAASIRARKHPQRSPCTVGTRYRRKYWATTIRSQGKIDATLEVKCGVRRRKQSLELKTGKSGHSSEHAAQADALSRIVSSTVQAAIAESLVYLKDGITRTVKPRAMEMKGIIAQRNRLAAYLSKLKPDFLP